MKILAIDTSCDETAAAVTDGVKILSNIIWSQASAHAKFGGVMPSLARRMHEERIDWVVDRAIKKSRLTFNEIDAVAVTIGPGLSIALGVGVNKAKELATKYNKKLIAVNHLEGHLLSSFANYKLQITNYKFPLLGLVISGGNTVFVKINKIGSYEILAQTTDDALGEALDKGARMLGLGYPGGAILEKMASSSRFSSSGQANLNPYKLPIPIVGQEKRMIFTYSGIKTAMMREISKANNLSKQNICDLSAAYQNVAFKHVERVLDYIFRTYNFRNTALFVGGGVSANTEIRKRLRKICKNFNIKTVFPSSKKLYGDNAAMIGIAAYLNQSFIKPEEIDRKPNLKLA